MISSNVPRMLKRMVFARGYSERMSNNLAPSPRVWRGRDALQERVPTMANARTKPHAEGSAPVVYDRSTGRGGSHTSCFKKLYLFFRCVLRCLMQHSIYGVQISSCTGFDYICACAFACDEPAATEVAF